MRKHARFFKQLTTVVSALLLAVCLTACGSAQNTDSADQPKPAEDGKVEASVESKTVPYVKDFAKAKKSEEGEATLYFVEGGDIPYVALSQYMPLLSEALAGSGIEGVQYEVERIEPGGHVYAASRSDNNSMLTINTENDSMSFTDFNTFTQKPGVTALVTIADLPDPQEVDTSGMMDELEAAKTEKEQKEIAQKYERMGNLENGLIQAAGQSYNRSGGFKDLNCGEYNIDIVENNGECYVPLQTLNDLFMNNIYINYVFNGEKLFGLKYGSEMTEEISKAQATEMSEKFAGFNFNELRFLLDNFYGLKAEHNIDNFYDFFVSNDDLMNDLIGTDADKFDAAIGKLLNTYLDDGHSAFTEASWRSQKSGEKDATIGALDTLTQFGPSNKSMFSISEEFKKARNKAFPDGVPMYQEIGDTAFVTFDSFVAETNLEDYYSSKRKYDPDKFVITADEDEEPADMVDLIRYANKKINRDDSPVKNVVVDLSNNGGGNSDAAVFVISWLLGRADIALKDTFTGAQTFMSCTSDTNLNNLYGEEDDTLLTKDVDVYCLISPSSFSCGNLVPAALKLSHRATLIGQTSGGGSCVVLPCTSASGTFFQISGSKQLALPKNGSFYNIDSGIDPDVVLSKAKSYYDRDALVEYLHDLK